MARGNGRRSSVPLPHPTREEAEIAVQQKIRVLVVDDSAVIRTMVSAALTADPGIQVVATANDGRQAMQSLAEHPVDIVTLDVEMPVMNGLQTVREIRKRSRDLPIIMFSSLTAPSARVTMKALFLGANDYVTKPGAAGGGAGTRDRIRAELIPRIKALCAKRLSAAAPRGGSARAARPSAPPPLARRTSAARTPSILAIGVSTGGPDALSSVVPRLPATFPVPIVIVQHMPPMFTAFLAKNLESRSSIPVKEAAAGDELRPGRAYVAPGDYHMEVAKRGGKGLTVRLHQEPPENACRPSVDVLFRSVARTCGARSLAVVLTGMGHDGREGCRQLRAADAQILAQDEASSVVWGMPGSVAKAGLADAVVPLGRVADEILRRVRPGSAAAAPRAGAAASETRNAVVWSDALFSTGVPGVDRQHRELFDRLNVLIEATRGGEGARVIGETLHFLERYCVGHFRDEEAAMSRLKCPAAEENRKAHAGFLEDLMRMKLRFEREGASEGLAGESERKIRHWLVNHVMRVDRKLRQVAGSAR